MALPLDNFGYPVQAGRRYALGPKITGGVPVIVFHDAATDEMLLRRVHGDPRPQRVDEVDPSAHWTLIDENDVEVLTSPDDESPSEAIDRAVAQAKKHRDAISTIEKDLIEKLNAHDDEFLRDEIQQALFGDGDRVAVLHRFATRTVAA